MPLENLLGNVYIGDLNSDWPLGTDIPDAGDDHVRGIKNVLKRSFPNIAGPVTLTHTQINNGGIPAGSVLPFYQAAAPTGWTRILSLTESRMIRIVPTASAGGGTGGTDDPILCTKVASHVHPVTGTSADADAAHTHPLSGSTPTGGSHGHTIDNMTYGPYGASGISVYQRIAGYGITIGVGGAHSHSLSGGTAASANATHGHDAGTLSAGAAVDAANWAPRYYDCVLCSKDA